MSISDIDYCKLIPKTGEQVVITHVENDTFLLSNYKYGYQFYINTSTKELLSLVNGENSIEQIKSIYNKNQKSDLESQQIYYLLYGKLAKRGVIVTDREITKRKKASYINLRIDFLKGKWLQKCPHIFFKLFIPPFFSISFFVLLGSIWINSRKYRFWFLYIFTGTLH